ncbi:MAG: hypothetical protein KAI47_08700 [Deltaproteobacteria bacterium]|nr:hypothetical protein [Deltaproteobacteria bacterium]
MHAPPLPRFKHHAPLAPRHKRTGLALLLLWSIVAPTPVDARAPKRLKPTFHPALALTDGKGHYFILDDRLKSSKGIGGRIFYGNPKKLYLQRVTSGGSNQSAGTWSATIRDERMLGVKYSQLYRDAHGAIIMQCDRRKTQLTVLHDAEARHLLKHAKLYDHYAIRKPHLLARDDTGRYYYIERLGRSDHDRGIGLGFRLWIGRRGKMHLQRARDTIADEAGVMVFTTQGTIKTNGRRDRAWWIAKGQKTRLELTVVPRNKTTSVMIYRDLGVYSGLRFWRPCDDL